MNVIYYTCKEMNVFLLRVNQVMQYIRQIIIITLIGFQALQLLLMFNYKIQT